MSICIPTYNRVQEVTNCVKRIVSGCTSEEIEIVVSDNASMDETEKEIRKIKDPRLKYYRNDKNLGIAGNVLKMVERANSEFIFIHWDDDFIELDAIPWILETLKKSKNLNQILGKIENGYGGIYWSCKILCGDCEDKIFKPCPESWEKLFFSYSHGGGRILRKKSIDLKYAEKFIESALSPYMHLILAIHPSLYGDTLCTSKTLYYKISERSKSVGHLIQGRPYWHPISTAERFSDRIRIIYDVVDNIKVQRVLLKKQREFAAYKLLKSFSDSWVYSRSLKPFFLFLTRILNIKEISRSPEFYLDILRKTINSILFKSIIKTEL